MHDLVIAGAGPAGSIAALIAARAGARVLLLDRSRFPRDKMCGDTLNPGALALLARLGIAVPESALPIAGMLVTGPRRVRVRAAYPDGLSGRSLLRRDFDAALLAAAARAGADVEEGVCVTAPAFGADAAVAGVLVRGSDGREQRVPARLTIAADGRASRLARACGLARHATRPRRWAIGAYFSDVSGMSGYGEMHVRAGCYIGVAPVPGGLTNACVVTADRERLREGPSLLAAVLRGDGELAERFRGARQVTRETMLGPLAVECDAPGAPGLLLAGDAAGFIDPMTGDGLRLAMRGGELAAVTALAALARGHADAHLALAAARRGEFAAKWRFNRTLRAMVGSADAVRCAAYASRLSSWPLSRVIRYAGDVHAA